MTATITKARPPPPRLRRSTTTRDPFAPLLDDPACRRATIVAATEDERYDAAVRLHELGTDEALRRLDERPGHEEARAILRDARWDAPSSGPVPLLSAQGRLRAIADVVALRARHAAALASRRWASASVSAGLAGLVAGAAGGVALALVPESETGIEVAVTLALVGAAAGALGGAGIGAGLAAAESLARSARAAALTLAGAVAGLVTGWLAHHLVRSLLGGVFGRDVAGACRGVRRPRRGRRRRRRLRAGHAPPVAGRHGRAPRRRAMARGADDGARRRRRRRWSSRWLGRHLVGSSLDVMADTFAGSQVGLDPLARLLGEDSLRPITRTLVSGFEALMFGSGLAFGLTRRPGLIVANHGHENARDWSDRARGSVPESVILA